MKKSLKFQNLLLEYSEMLSDHVEIQKDDTK